MLGSTLLGTLLAPCWQHLVGTCTLLAPCWIAPCWILGRTSISFDGHLVPHWASQGGWALGAEAQADLQRVLLAINDQPLSINLTCSYQRWPGMAEQAASHELRATLGLSMGWQLR
ncbi:MAG: hypothetical protein JRF33_01430 [Deltaproteobacteria bacterium]|nr:hypothetical protein [Deltaproteobacteria bacterium]